MASPLGGIDPQTLMALIQKLGLAPGAAAMGGPGQPPLGAPPPALNAGAPPGLPPAPSNNVPGLTPTPPSPGGAPPFGPPPGAPEAPGAPPAAGAAPKPPGSPYMDAVKMTMGQSAYGPEERALDRQMKMADELRAAKAPGMRGTPGQGYTMAASPLEFAATALDRVGGKMMGDRTEQKQKDMFEQRMKRLQQDMGASKDMAGDY